MSDPAAPHPYDRVNFLIRVALFLGVLLILAVMVGDKLGLSAEAKGALTLILGRVWGYIDNIYAFEFSSTRSSKAKDETIKELSKGPTVIPSAVGDVNMTADTVNVEGSKP